MGHLILLILRQCQPQRSYRIFRFLVTVFLLFRRKQRWLLWQPLPPRELVATIRTLGTSFVKLAQVLATRADFFDDDYLAALRQLHDQMPPMSDAQRRHMMQRAFGDHEFFSAFDDQPIASASIGQVHRARLKKEGDWVAVKLLRADIRWIVRIDIVLLNLFMRLFQPLFTDQTRHSIESILRAFTQVVLEEVNMSRELANLEQFRQIYHDHQPEAIRFPTPYPAYCSESALVMSFEEGFRIDDVEAVKKLTVSFEELMQHLVMFYTEQMLVKGIFHADPHPGNLLVTAEGQLVFLDFGMVSRIPQAMRQAMIYAVKAAYERDYDLLVSATRRLGILTEESDPRHMSEVAERLFDIFDSEQLDASSMQELAFGVLDVLHDQPFKLPQDVIYVMRVSSLIEGLGTQYVTNFNGVKDILPILKKNLPRALGEDSLGLDKLIKEAAQLPLTLSRARRVTELAEQGDLVVRMANADRQYLLHHLAKLLRTLAVILFWLAVAFYLQRAPYSWAQNTSWIALAIAGLLTWRGMRLK